MPGPMSRRDLLTWSLAAGAAPAVLGLAGRAAQAQIKPQPGADKLTAYQFGPQIHIRWADDPVTCYRSHPTQKYPYFYPVTGPVSGLSLTTESGSSYPHHRSLLFACDRVNGGNYWQGDVKAGQIISKGPKIGQCTPESAEILDECEWQVPGGPVQMRDQRVFKVLETVLKVYEERQKRIDTPRLNRFVEELMQTNPPPSIKGRDVRLLYATQPMTEPPLFVFFTRYPELVTDNFRRYLERRLREEFGFEGVPIRLAFRKKS